MANRDLQRLGIKLGHFESSGLCLFVWFVRARSSIKIPWDSSAFFTHHHLDTLPETNSSHLKMDGWNTILSYWGGLFSGAFAVSFREGNIWELFLGSVTFSIQASIGSKASQIQDSFQTPHLDVPLEVNGSKVIGSVGYFTLIYTPFNKDR